MRLYVSKICIEGPRLEELFDAENAKEFIEEEFICTYRLKNIKNHNYQ
jgi:hypothetical protein